MLLQPSHPIVMFVLFNLAESPSSGSHPLSARPDQNISSSSALPVRRESIITPGVEKPRYYVAHSKPMHICVCAESIYLPPISLSIVLNLDARKSIVCNLLWWWPSEVLFFPWLAHSSMGNHYNRLLFLYLHCQGLLKLYFFYSALPHCCAIGSTCDHPEFWCCITSEHLESS